MENIILWLILIIISAYHLNRLFFGFGAERKFNTALKELKYKFDKYNNQTNKSNLDEDDIKYVKTEIEKLVNTHEDYLHLKEKYKHNFNTKRKIENDWLTYTQIALNMQGYETDFSALTDGKQLTKTYEKRYNDKIRAEEIEKRFHKLLSF